MDMLLILINIFMLIKDKVATRKPVIRQQTRTFLVNRIDVFNLWELYLAFFLCQAIGIYAHCLCQLPKQEAKLSLR